MRFIVEILNHKFITLFLLLLHLLLTSVKLVKGKLPKTSSGEGVGRGRSLDLAAFDHEVLVPLPPSFVGKG